MSGQTINQMFQASIIQHADKDALRYKESGTYQGISYRDLGEEVKKLSLGLVGLGIGKGDKVALLSDPCPQWAIADLAILAAGAVTVPIFPTLPASQVEYLLNDSGAKAIIVSTARQLKKVTPVQSNLPALEKIILIDAPPAEESVLTFEKVREIGEKQKKPDETYQQRVESVGPDDLTTIIYTSRLIHCSQKARDTRERSIVAWNLRTPRPRRIEDTQPDYILAHVKTKCKEMKDVVNYQHGLSNCRLN